MTTEVVKKADTAPAKVSVINSLASKLSCDPAKLVPMLKKTAFATCKTDEEFMAMCIVANTYRLNPILKEIYAFPARNGQVVPVVGVDGWIKMMNACPEFDGIEFDEGSDYCTAIIYRKDRAHPVKATEWLAECMGTTDTWKRWPRRMLRHKAMIQGARIAFGFSGIYDEDEANRIDSVSAIPTVATVQKDEKKPRETAKDALRAKLGISNDAANQDTAEASKPTEDAHAKKAHVNQLAGGSDIMDLI